MFYDASRVTEELTPLVDVLRKVDGGASDVERVDQLAVLERVKAAVAAAQVRITVAFVESQAEVAQAWRERARECSAVGDFEGWRAARDEARLATFAEDDDGAARVADDGSARAGGGSAGSETGGAGAGGGVQPKGSAVGGGVARHGRPRRAVRRESLRSVAGQVALARRESPARGSHHVRLALRLHHDMPETLAALEQGTISEWRAAVIARETEGLGEGQRRQVDAEVARRLGDEMGSLGDRELARRVRAAAYRVEPGAVMARRMQAEADRRVTIRPAPDTMAYLTALLPVAQAVATHAALTAAADSARAAGDDRTKGQVMADELVVRLTGQKRADDISVEVQLVMTDRALFAGDDVPAQLSGHGAVPAAWARRLVAGPSPRRDRGRGVEGSEGAVGAQGVRDADGDPFGDADRARARIWLRRLYADPTAAELVAMESTRRTFDGGLRRFLVARRGGLSHAVVRCPDPPPRPRRGPRERRPDERHQRPGALRALQPHETAAGMAVRGRGVVSWQARTAPSRHHHPDGPRLRVRGAAAAAGPPARRR
jgi:hypothetical protein